MKGTTQNGQSLVIDIPQYTISRTENYKAKNTYSLQDILTKFVSLSVEYLSFIGEKIHMKNQECYKFIIMRGIETIIHVFSILFYYTKNIDLTYYHSQKAYYFYIEFIEQISDDNVSFLQLSSRDATTFVYKKTIYEINNEYKKTFRELLADEKAVLHYLDTYMYIYKNIVLCYIQSTPLASQNCTNILLKINNLDPTKTKLKQAHLDNIILFTNLYSNRISNNKTLNVNKLEIIEEFIRHFLSKKKLPDMSVIRQNIYHYFDNDTNTNTNTNTSLAQIFIL
jgi:hypothetical protein